MTDFKAGGVPTPDYDTEDINYVSQKTEFTEDVFVYGKLYADLGGDVQTFSTAGVERLRIDKSGNLLIGTNSSTVYDDSSGSGVVIRGVTGAVDIMRNNDHPLLLNRTGGDGQMIMLHRDGVNESALCLRDNALTVEMPANTERLRIDNDGQVIFTPMTQTQRDALTAQAGGVIYNSTTNKLQCYNGTTWNNLF